MLPAEVEVTHFYGTIPRIRTNMSRIRNTDFFYFQRQASTFRTFMKVRQSCEQSSEKKTQNCRLHLGEDDPVGCDDYVILRHLSLCDLPLLVPVVHQHAQPSRLHLRSIVYKLGENLDVIKVS